MQPKCHERLYPPGPQILKKRNGVRAIQKSLDKLSDRALSLSKGAEMPTRFDKLSVRLGALW